MNLTAKPRSTLWWRFRILVVRAGRELRQYFPAALVLSMLLSAGCTRNEPRADLVIINGAEPESLDPAIITGEPDLRAVTALFGGLTQVNPTNGSALPGLAERWDISPDQKVYTFHLRTNLVWSTGEPLTADDVIYSWLRALNPATASDYAGQLYFLKNGEEYNTGVITDPSLVGCKALDRYTVRAELKNPTAFFLDLCAFPTLTVVPRWTIEKYGDRWLKARPLPSSGPYELVTWRLNDKIRLRKNERYWDAANTRLRIVDLLPVVSAPTALNLYETGAADVVWDKDLVPTELMDVLAKRPDFHSFHELGVYFVRINTTRKPFDDPRVRQALALVIDKDRIIRKIVKTGGIAADSLTPPGVARYQAPKGLGYDPDKARRLLAEAGFPGGRGFPRMQYIFNAAAGGAAVPHEKIGVELQQMWHDELGIDVELRQLEWGTFLSAESKLDYDIGRSSWIGDYNDADTFLNLFMSDNGNNETGWKSAAYDGLIRSADEQLDLAAREKKFQEAEAMLIRDAVPIIPIYYYVGLNYFDDRKIKGIYNNILDLHPINAIWKVNAPVAESAQSPGMATVQLIETH
jgi:oligopeptide transport system substrate-binding protein